MKNELGTYLALGMIGNSIMNNRNDRLDILKREKIPGSDDNTRGDKKRRSVRKSARHKRRQNRGK